MGVVAILVVLGGAVPSYCSGFEAHSHDGGIIPVQAVAGYGRFIVEREPFR